MRFTSLKFSCNPFRSASLPLTLSTLFAALLTTGCSGGSSPGSSPPTTPGANTNVVLMLTSTGSDKLQAFNLQLTSLTLTSKAGNKVTVFSSNPYPGTSPEFTHLNGLTEPYLTVPIPQDTYISATATVGSAQFTCVSLDSSGSLNNSTFAYGATPANQVTATLPVPITISTVPSAIAIDLQSAASATYSNCQGGAGSTYTINPNFNLEALPFGSPLNALANGEPTTVQGTIASVNATANTITIASADGPTWTVALGSDTVFQGIGGAGALAAGQPVDADIYFDTSGNISTHRLQVLDTNTSTLTYAAGSIEQLASSQPTFFALSNQTQGFFLQPGNAGPGIAFNYGNAVFNVSGYLNNLANLPFTPVFNASTLTDGQRIAITTHATTVQGGPTYVPAASVTLLPQTLNGTLTNIITTGTGPAAIVAYTISLAPYDLFPNLNTQQAQPTRLTQPATAVIYTRGGSTGIQNLAIGQPYRFTGLVFNDGGTLKMDCLQILAGVTP